MRNRQDPHPFSIPILATLGAAAFGLLYFGFGVGKEAMTWLASVALFYAVVVAFTFAVGGIVWLAIRLFAGRN